MTDVGPPVLSVFGFAFDRLCSRLAGLTDDEYFWEPTRGAWSLRHDGDGRWHLDGGGGGRDAPDPAPVTTIAWRIGHLAAMALGGFTDRRFPELSLDSQELPGSAADAIDFLERNYQRWMQGLESLDVESWEEPLGAQFGPYAEDTTLDLALHVLDELVHHGAEIALLRDLYPHLRQLEAEAGRP